VTSFDISSFLQISRARMETYTVPDVESRAVPDLFAQVPKKSLDAVCFFHTFHMLDTSSMLSELHRILRCPGFLISAWNDRCAPTCTASQVLLLLVAYLRNTVITTGICCTPATKSWRTSWRLTTRSIAGTCASETQHSGPASSKKVGGQALNYTLAPAVCVCMKAVHWKRQI
jgi:SAM-dependent methyltransferase